MSACIYKIENDVNGKIYVGKTLSSIEKRFAEHIRDSRKETENHRPLYRAFNKYGIEHFHISILEECDVNCLSEREIYWIEKLQSYHYGYNVTRGGDGTILYDYDEIVSLIKQGYNRIEISQKIGCCPDVVSNVSKLYNIPILVKPNKLRQEMEKSKVAINQYTLKGEYIQSFSSVMDAARWIYENGYCKTFNSGVRSHIAEAARGIRKTAYKFLWKIPS